MTLAVCVGLHVLALMLLWRHVPLARVPAGARGASILWLQPPPPRAQPSLPEPLRSAAAHPGAGVAGLQRRAHIAQPSPEPSPGDPGLLDHRTSAPAITAPESAASASAPSSSASASSSVSASAAAPAADAGMPAAGFAAGLAARQAGRIDRELRGGKSGVPLQADTPWSRFGRALEAAHIDHSMSVLEDMYTSPDGVVYYRFRQGKQTRCRRSGGVSIGITGNSMGSLNDAGSTECPKGATWTPVD